jgi:WD40 repeat protein
LEVESSFIKIGKGKTAVIDWAPNGELLAVGRNDGTIGLFEGANEALLLEGHTKTVSAVSWNRDGSRLATAGRDNTIVLWSGTEKVATLKGHIPACLESRLGGLGIMCRG